MKHAAQRGNLVHTVHHPRAPLAYSVGGQGNRIVAVCRARQAERRQDQLHRATRRLQNVHERLGLLPVEIMCQHCLPNSSRTHDTARNVGIAARVSRQAVETASAEFRAGRESMGRRADHRNRE